MAARSLKSVQFGTDFGQKVDLCVRIREILRNYPEGLSIISELVQNADDATARSIKLVLDERQWGVDGVPGAWVRVRARGDHNLRPPNSHLSHPATLPPNAHFL